MADITRLHVRLPLPPSVNHYWLNNRSGGKRISRAARVFRRDVAVLVAGAPRFGTELVGIRITWMLDSRVNRGDYDNRLKPLGDALEHAGVIANDRQIREAHIYYGEPIPHGGCTIEIWRLTT